MRMKPLIPGLLVALLATAAAQAEGDVDAGKLHFKKCAICHAAEPGQNKIGPSLFGIVGRKSASGANFSYSDAMRKFDHVWDVAMLDTYRASRRRDTARGVAFTDLLVSLFADGRWLPSWGRGFALTALDLFPPARRFLAQRMIHGAPTP